MMLIAGNLSVPWNNQNPFAPSRFSPLRLNIPLARDMPDNCHNREFSWLISKKVGLPDLGRTGSVQYRCRHRV